MDIDALPEVTHQDMPLSNPQVQDYHPISHPGMLPRNIRHDHLLLPSHALGQDVFSVVHRFFLALAYCIISHPQAQARVTIFVKPRSKCIFGAQRKTRGSISVEGQSLRK
jgi:hypothetical protein